jgi:prolyl-tRNA synthetase
MKESTLIGYPWMIIVGRQLKAEGKVEIQERKTGRKVLLPKAELSAYLKESSKTL